MVINRDKISDFVEPWNEEALLADGLESAFIGVAERAGQNAVAVYDTQKVIDVFVSDGMTEEEAGEHVLQIAVKYGWEKTSYGGIRARVLPNGVCIGGVSRSQ